MMIYSFMTGTRWSNQLFNTITIGNLNVLLTKPMNIFILYIARVNSSSFVYLLTYSLVFFPFIINDTNVLTLLLCFLLVIFIGIVHILFYFMLDSFSWISLNVGKTAINTVFHNSQDILRMYLSPLFTSTKIEILMMVLPIFYSGLIFVPLFHVNFEVLKHLKVLILLLILFITIITINWKYGLKRYEAFS